MKIEDILKMATGCDPEMVKQQAMETLNGPPEERDRIMKKSKEMIGARMDKKLEDHSIIEKIGAVMAFDACVSSMPTNIKWLTDCFITITSLYIEDGNNGSHGAVSNCLINHNEKVGLHCRRARNGMTISNCCIFCGELIIEDCAGINLTSGIISCDMRIRGDRANRVSGNYIIPGEYRFEMPPPTLVQDNFTDAGPWEMNRPAGEQ